VIGLIGFAYRCPVWTVRERLGLRVEISVEQRYRAVLAVERGEPKIVVATQFGCPAASSGSSHGS
jgi:hypothetical protein